MPVARIDFDAPDLAARIEQLSQQDINLLPFGVVLLDRDDTVLFYSATEARQSGYGDRPLGQNFFTMSRCAGKADFQTRVRQAQEAGTVDLEFAFPGDSGDPNRGLRIRVQSARAGGVWVFIERD